MVFFSQIHGILPDQGKQICGFHQIGFGIQVLMETLKKVSQHPGKILMDRHPRNVAGGNSGHITYGC